MGSNEELSIASATNDVENALAVASSIATSVVAATTETTSLAICLQSKINSLQATHWD
jgi:hypothetical protein